MFSYKCRLVEPRRFEMSRKESYLDVASHSGASVLIPFATIGFLLFVETQHSILRVNNVLAF